MSNTININLSTEEIILLKRGLKSYRTELSQRKNDDLENNVKIRKAHDLTNKLASIQNNDKDILNTDYMSIDYFMKIINYMDTEFEYGDYLSREAYEMFKADLLNYRSASIRQYNNVVNRGTDAFCIKKFLNDYKTSVEVFNLHPEIAKSEFYILINEAFRIIHGID